MIADAFWWVAYSYVSLSIIGLILLAALVVGYFPLLKYFPVIGPYVLVGKLVSFIAVALLCFLVGARTADERQEIKHLQAENARLLNHITATNEAAEKDALQAIKDAEQLNDLGKKADETPANNAPCFVDGAAADRLRSIK